MEAIRFAKEPLRGFVFSSIYMEGEKIVQVLTASWPMRPDLVQNHQNTVNSFF